VAPKEVVKTVTTKAKESIIVQSDIKTSLNDKIEIKPLYTKEVDTRKTSKMKHLATSSKPKVSE